MIEWDVLQSPDTGLVIGARAIVEASSRTFHVQVSKRKRGGWLWDVIDQGGADRLPSIESGLAEELADAQGEAIAIVAGWAA